MGKRTKQGKFAPGESGNPAGKKPGTLSITAAIKKKLEEVYTDLKNPEERKTYLEKVIDAIFDNAIVGKDARTLKDIWAYIDGLPKGTLGIDVDKEKLEQLTSFFRIVAGGKVEEPITTSPEELEDGKDS